MSYTKTFSRTISIHYSGSTSYPASEHGGTVRYNGIAHETIHVNIHVQTEPFDNAVHDCNKTVDLLTGAVAATEAAQVASIRKNAKRVGGTILDGFFRTVNSEITQQIVELESQINANLAQLNELSKRCQDKKRQMQVDYERLCSRYQKVFAELNTELENRIYQIDEPVFRTANTINRTTGQLPEAHDDRVAVVAVSSREEAGLNASIAVSRTKSNARQAIGVIYQFLLRQRETDSVLVNSTVPNAGSSPWRYAPVLFTETVTGKGQVNKRADYPASLIPDKQRGRIEQMCEKVTFTHLDAGNREALGQYFENEISDKFDTDTPHNARVKEYIRKFFSADLAEI